eukprot:5705289-Pleurochrysis_carterae.AAC.1
MNGGKEETRAKEGANDTRASPLGPVPRQCALKPAEMQTNLRVDAPADASEAWPRANKGSHPAKRVRDGA